MRVVMLAAVVLALCAGPAMAAPGIPLEGVDVSYTAFNPIGDGDSLTLPTLTLRIYANRGPATPTTWGNVDDWAKSNLGIEVPFEGDAHSLIRARGIGLSEAVQISTVQSTPIRAGIAWVSGAGTCLFVRIEALAIKL